MIYIYRRAASNSARDLAEQIGGRRWRGVTTPITQKARVGDKVVCWGETLPPIQGVSILNGAPIRSKFEDARTLKDAGNPTVEVNQTRPIQEDPALNLWTIAAEQAEEFINMDPGTTIARTRPLLDGVAQLLESINGLNVALRNPQMGVAGDWIGRLNNHVGGNDLLNPADNPHYWVKKEVLRREFRVHSFLGKSIRAGVKDVRPDFQNPHPWIRSWDGGWKILYDGVTSRQIHRDLAHRAVSALGLQFGAVDIGEKEDGSLIVLEVNRAPGLSDGTVNRYAAAIEEWSTAI